MRETRRRPERFDGDANPLTGVLYCADYGHKMYHKQGDTGRPDQPHHEYVCSSYRHYSRSCTCHYIRVSVIENLILDAIRSVSGYVRKNEAKFVERVLKQHDLKREAAVKESRRKLTQACHKVYARADEHFKRKALEQAYPSPTPISEFVAWRKDDDLLDWLKNLGK